MIRCILISAFAAVMVCQAADLYRIAGVVVNSETGVPMAHSRLFVMPYGTTRTVASQIAGDDGRFSFEVPQGKFSLLAGTRDTQQAFGLRAPDNLIASSIVAGPGIDNSNLTFRWFPLGAISGRVVDESGEPVESALIQLLRQSIFAGRRIVNTVAWTRTDDRGEYRFGPLRGGSYFLAATGTPWYSRQIVIAPGVPKAPAVSYAPAYYPNTRDATLAEPLALKPGQEVRADFSLTVVNGANVVVNNDAPVEATGLIALLTDGVAGRDGFQRQERFYGGRPFTFNSVPPGHYVVRITVSQGTSDFSGRRAIDVNGTDVTVEVPVRSAPTVSGVIKPKDPNTKLGNLVASLVHADTGSTAILAAARPDGSFIFPNVAAGKWRPSIRTYRGYFVSEVHAEGTEFQDGVINVQDGESVTLRMTLSDETGRVKGFVMRDEKPVEGVMVVLVPASGAHDQIRDWGFQTDSDGSFDFESIPAEDYLLFAVEDTQIEHSNPAAVRPYLANAKRIHVEAHQVYSEKIGLTQPVEEKKP